MASDQRFYPPSFSSSPCTTTYRVDDSRRGDTAIVVDTEPAP
jgi:hypothetical protein